MKLTTLMVIFTLFSLNYCGLLMDSETAKKLRNPLLSLLGDQHSNLTDFIKHCQNIAFDYFGLVLEPQVTVVETFYKFFDLNEVLVAPADATSFRLNNKETPVALNALYEKSLPDLKVGQFSNFFDEAIQIQRKNFAYLLGNNLKQDETIEKLSWTSSIYTTIGDNFAEVIGNQKSEIASSFKQGIVKMLSQIEEEAKIYNSYERIIKQTDVELMKELQLLIDGVLEANSDVSDQNMDMLRLKAVFIAQIIGDLEGQDVKTFYFEVVRYLINNRVILYKKALQSKQMMIRPKLNKWILNLINQYLKLLVSSDYVDTAFELVQKMITKELPNFVNRQSFGKLLAQIPNITTYFDFEDSNLNPVDHIFKTFVLNTLIVSGNTDFFDRSNKIKAINAFLSLAYTSFKYNSFLHKVSPIMFNNIVADQNSVEFTVALFRYVTDGAISSVVNPDFTNAYEVLNEAIDDESNAISDESEQSISKYYVPAKIANFLMAQIFRSNFNLKFEDKSRAIIGLNEALSSEEFSKLDKMIQHWWARDSNFQVHEEQVANKEYIEKLITNNYLNSNSFRGIVTVTPTQDDKVFNFKVNDFEYNFIEEEIVIEEDNHGNNIISQVPQKEDALVEDIQPFLNRKQKDEPTGNSRRGPQLLEEEENDDEEENQTQQHQSNAQDEERKNIVKVLKGGLKPDELQLLIDAEDLAETLKNGYSFLGDDGIPVEITYTQVVNYDSDCHKAILASLAK